MVGSASPSSDDNICTPTTYDTYDSLRRKRIPHELFPFRLCRCRCGRYAHHRHRCGTGHCRRHDRAPDRLLQEGGGVQRQYTAAYAKKPNDLKALGAIKVAGLRRIEKMAPAASKADFEAMAKHYETGAKAGVAVMKVLGVVNDQCKVDLA